MIATGEPVIALESDAGEIKIVPQPAGMPGYEDLRHRLSERHSATASGPRSPP